MCPAEGIGSCWYKETLSVVPNGTGHIGVLCFLYLLLPHDVLQCEDDLPLTLTISCCPFNPSLSVLSQATWASPCVRCTLTCDSLSNAMCFGWSYCELCHARPVLCHSDLCNVFVSSLCKLCHTMYVQSPWAVPCHVFTVTMSCAMPCVCSHYSAILFPVTLGVPVSEGHPVQ